MTDTKITSRLLKLLALAKRGVGGEKENAQRMLDKLLAKHHMKLSDIINDDEALIRSFFNYGSPLEKKLLINIVCAVTNSYSYTEIIKHGLGRKMGFKLTRSQFNEIRFLYIIYRKELTRGVDNFYKAFVYKNDIFPTVDTGKSRTELSLQEKKDLADVMKLMDSIERTAIHKQITKESY